MKVLLRIPLSPYSGYGNDGIGITRAFVAAGADVYLQPTISQFPLPADVLKLGEKTLTAPFDLIVTHVDPAAMECDPELKKSGLLNVAWTMWEYDSLGNMQFFDEARDDSQSWGDDYKQDQKTINSMKENKVAQAKDKWKKKIKLFDAVVAYDEVTAGAFEPYFRGPVIVQQGGYDPDDWGPIEREWDIPEFRFCMIGVLSERKDPFVAIQAFSEAKNEDPEFDKWARLSLKTTAPGLHSKMEEVYPGLRIFYDMWPTEMVKSFYAANHVLLAPSRGEGKNMPALEFLSSGGSVIATNWGGHQQWLSDQYAYPLDYELHPVDSAHPDVHNARASVQHLKELMLHCFHNREEVRQKGQVGAQTIPALASWDNVIERLLQKLRPLPNGEEVWMKYVIAKHENGSG